MIRSDDARKVLAQIVDLVSADPVLDDAAVDRAARLAVYSRRVGAPAGRQLDAIESALRSGAGLGELAVPRRPEAELRRFLGELYARIEDLRPWPERRYEQLDPSAWNSRDVTAVAQLDLSPARLGDRLEILFERVLDGDAELQIAVLRLTASGAVVALARRLREPPAGTTLLRQGPGSGEEVLRSFLSATGLGAGSVIARLDAEPGDRSGGDGS